jgi:excisionase family DNA binding protein
MDLVNPTYSTLTHHEGGFVSTKYITLEQASEISQIPVSTLRKRITEGVLPAYKPGRGILIDPRDLDLLIKRSKVNSGS